MTDKKAVTRRPALTEVTRVINKGGSSREFSSEIETEERERIFNLRVPESLVAQVDEIRKGRTGKISRNTWILEAMSEKITRELGTDPSM